MNAEERSRKLKGVGIGLFVAVAVGYSSPQPASACCGCPPGMTPVPPSAPSGGGGGGGVPLGPPPAPVFAPPPTTGVVPITPNILPTDATQVITPMIIPGGDGVPGGVVTGMTGEIEGVTIGPNTDEIAGSDDGSHQTGNPNDDRPVYQPYIPPPDPKNPKPPVDPNPLKAGTPKSQDDGYVCHNYVIEQLGYQTAYQAGPQDVTNIVTNRGYNPTTVPAGGDLPTNLPPGTVVQIGTSHVGIVGPDGTVTNYTKAATQGSTEAPVHTPAEIHHDTLSDLRNENMTRVDGNGNSWQYQPYKNEQITIWTPPAQTKK